jgi:tRNA A37 threonylcarbamoyladenosine modification protein TsaB
MKILSLDSSSPVSSVAVVSFENGVPEARFVSETPHARSDSSALFTALRQAVDSCGSPDAVCVGLGPGSYNGLRASIAAARAMATGLRVPLHALPSPLGWPGPDSGFWAIGDARGGHYWIAAVQREAFLEEPILLPPSEIPSHLANRPDFPILSPGSLPGIPEIVPATPSAARLAMIAKKLDPLFLASGTPEPLYLKPPHITAPRSPAS